MVDFTEFAKRIDAMDDEDREHFRNVINALSYCYTQENTKGIVIIDNPSGVVDTITINCDDMEAYDMANSTTQYLEFLNTKDAPPKEQFN